jgi:hypothetical protein
MTIEQIGILLSLVLTLLSLVLTIVGWSVTAYYQRRILERQIAAEKEKEVRQLIIPHKIQQLEQIKNWVEEGYKLWHLWKDRPRQGYISTEKLGEQREEIDRLITTWVSVDYMTIESLVSIIEPYDDEPPHSKPHGIKSLWARKRQTPRSLFEGIQDEPLHSKPHGIKSLWTRKRQAPGRIFERVQDNNSLTDMLSKLVHAMPTGNPNYYDEHPDFETQTDMVFDTYYPEIMRRIDELIEQAVKEEKPKRKR